MEGSKTFSKNFMARHRIPTAEYRNFSDYDTAKAYLDTVQHSVVIKASGLAAGKGVIIPTSKNEAHAALKEIMLDHQFGVAGDEVVIEEFLEGEELSILTFSDGYTIRSLPPAQDHKRIFDGDQGPNTGGMGAYAPTRVASEEVVKEIDEKIIKPTISGMRREATPFVGILFTGLMITRTGPKVLEYNVRGGDPETQTLLPLLSKDTDLAEIMIACTDHWLDAVSIKIEPKFSATVIAAAAGYPGSYKKGTEMKLQKPADNVLIFHAGTALKEGKLTTTGGRVIAATSTGPSLEIAVQKAYGGISTINFEGMQYRKDIAHRAFAHPTPAPTNKPAPLTYASAGVSIDAGNNLVKRIKPAVRSTRRPGADAEIGGFGGTLDLAAAGANSLQSPILVQAIDGVGTKLKIAHAVGKHDTVGIDLVAMNVNDLIVQGAEPMTFLDCYSCSKLDVDMAAAFIDGVAEGCRQSNCALIGGETAEMPGLYQGDEYDAAGCATGFVSREKILPATAEMSAGDVLLGLASNGVHSNGFSLVRRVLERERITFESAAPWDSQTTVGVSLLTPTRIYVKPLLPVIKKGLIKGMSHITGGGLIENVPRMLPSHLTAEIDVSTWKPQPVFSWLKKAGGISSHEMSRAFNNGIGMVLVVKATEAAQAINSLKGEGESVFTIGKLISRQEGAQGCILKNLAAWD